jgi:hypothetical protein
MVERSPAAAGFSRTFGSTRGWQDRASEAPAPGAFHHSVVASALAGVAVVPLRAATLDAAAGGDPGSGPGIEPAPGGVVATLIGTGAAGVIVVPAAVRPETPDSEWARWTARTQATLHRTDSAIACRWDAVWPDAPSLVAWLRTRSTALAEELDTIRGRVELVLHLSDELGADEAADLSLADGPGGRWLRQRARDRSRDAIVRASRAIDGPLASLVGTVRRAVPDEMAGRAIVRLLVDHAAVEAVRETAAELRRRGSIERLAGPWVPGPIGGHVTT